MTLLQYLIQDFCKRKGIRTVSELRVALGVAHSTASSLWCGKHPPRSITLRQKLHQLTGHAAFVGPMTTANKRQLMASYTLEPNLRNQATRTVYLLLAIRLDLQELITAGDSVLRDKLRQDLANATSDPDAIGTITTAMRALQSERTLETLRAEGQLAAIEGGTHASSRK